MQRSAASGCSFAEDLCRLGVLLGDTLMIHASLRAVGTLLGGSDALLVALEEAVGPDGTLLMTSAASVTGTG
jgi:aminoglycoside 3-N-acetyltransferase